MTTALDTQIGGDHYKQCAIQPVQFIEANNLGFLEGCVVKRLARHNKPTGKGRQDIEKAIHELQLLPELRYAPAATSAGFQVGDFVFIKGTSMTAQAHKIRTVLANDMVLLDNASSYRVCDLLPAPKASAR